MGKTADLAQNIITMVKEYNGCISALRNACDSLAQENRYYRDKYDQSKDTIESLKVLIKAYEHKLEIITDVISKHMEQDEECTHYITSMRYSGTNSDYMKIMKALEIPLSIDEVKE